MAETLLTVRDLSFGWPGQAPLFNRLDLQLQRGEVLAVLGPNGRGKSTLMQLLLGTLPLQLGEVERGKGIGFVPQHFSAPFAYRVLDIVLMGRARYVGLFRTPSRRITDWRKRRCIRWICWALPIVNLAACPAGNGNWY